jgi:response regulator RpfG family c-di-GMP phosphodiesterase
LCHPVSVNYNKYMKILIIDDSDTTRHLIISCLEHYLNQVEIVEVTSARMASALYSSDPYFQFIIGSLDLAGDSILSFHQLLQREGSAVPVLTYSKSEVQEGLPNAINLHIDESQIPTFKEQLIAALPLPNESSSNEAQPLVRGQQYKKVRLFYFWRFHQSHFPVYLKLGKEKYVKILNADQAYGPDFIEKYEGKHQNYLYIRDQDFNTFLELLYKKPLYEENPELPQEEKILRSQHFIQSMAISSGLTPNLIELANQSIENVEAFSRTKKSLTKMIEILKKRSGYNSDHATLLCYLTGALCDRLDWSARRSKEKLAMASLFHDITLAQQEVAALSYLDDLGNKGLNKETLTRYHNHPIKCAELVSEGLSQYPQVDIIIANHHERPDGSGFPFARDYNQIGPLPSLFIVAHDFVSRLYKKNFDFDCANEVIEEMKSEYRLGHFAKCLRALIDVVDHEKESVA